MRELIDKKEAIKLFCQMIDNTDKTPITCIREVLDSPKVIARCRDCKHWKDSDGKYRRGVRAQSKCPINIKAVYDGVFCCGMWERKTNDSC